MGIVWGPLATSESGVYLSPASCAVDARSLVEHVIMTVNVSDPYMGPQNWFPEASPLHTPKYRNPPYGDPTGMGSPNIDPHVIVSQNKGTPILGLPNFGNYSCMSKHVMDSMVLNRK